MIGWLRRLFGREGEEDAWEDLEAAGLDDAEGAFGDPGDDDFPYANRSAVLLVPKQPFVDWLAKACDERKTLEEARALQDRTVYLLEPWEGSWDWPPVLEAGYRAMFEQELAEWCEDRSRWPRNRNLAAFQNWFDVERCSAVIDLAGGPLAPLDFE